MDIDRDLIVIAIPHVHDISPWFYRRQWISTEISFCVPDDGLVPMYGKGGKTEMPDSEFQRLEMRYGIVLFIDYRSIKSNALSALVDSPKSNDALKIIHQVAAFRKKLDIILRLALQRL